MVKSETQRLKKEVIGLRDIPVLFVDNSAGIHQLEIQNTTKHFFIHEKIGKKLFEVQQISTQDQLADLMTKPFNETRWKLL